MVTGDGKSALYECRVMHHRLRPKEHRFNYRVFYLWLDLDELDDLHRSLRIFSRNRRNIFSFYDCDHLDLGETTTKENLLHWLANHEVAVADISRVRLLTFPRVFGYIFNPVCFYFCFDAEDRPLCAVAEVTNTFHEQKPYLLLNRDSDGRFRLITPKHFYVSPFSSLDLCFNFKLRMPGDHLDIHIDDIDGDGPVLLSSVVGERRTLTDARLLWVMLKYPLLTLRVIFLIHWHALLLWMKRIPFHRKAALPELQRDVLHPHPSIINSTKP